MNNDMLSSSFIESIPISNNYEILKEYAEIGLDSIIENDILRSIPIVKTIISIIKTSISIHDRILVKKILEFLTNLQDVSSEKKIDFIRKLEEDQKFEKKVGESLLLIIDRLDDLDKPGILAKIFSAYLQQKIEYDIFLKLSQSIDKAFISYLKQLDHYYEINLLNLDKNILQNLFNAGLVDIYFDPKLNTQYQRNHLGILFIETVFGKISDVPLIIPSMSEYENKLFQMICEEEIKNYPNDLRVMDNLKSYLDIGDELKYLLKKFESKGFVDLKEKAAFAGTDIKMKYDGFHLYFTECIKDKNNYKALIAKEILENRVATGQQIFEKLNIPFKIIVHIIESFLREGIIDAKGSNSGYYVNEIISKKALINYGDNN
jgi:hypothetical protein